MLQGAEFCSECQLEQEAHLAVPGAGMRRSGRTGLQLIIWDEVWQDPAPPLALPHGTGLILSVPGSFWVLRPLNVQGKKGFFSQIFFQRVVLL